LREVKGGPRVTLFYGMRKERKERKEEREFDSEEHLWN
jgi:hypothetical protein